MGRTRMVALGAAVAAVVAGAAVAAVVTPPATARLAAGEIPLGTALGRTWSLGGFSGLAAIGDSGRSYWTITDRGPNIDACGGKQYPLPAFAPEIVRVEAGDDGVLAVKKRIPLSFPAGPAVGFSVRPAPKNEASFGPSCEPLGTSPRGIDSEGVVVDPRDETFWIVDEYLPSVMHVKRDGKVVTRIVPVGTGAFATGAGAAVVEGFPATIGAAFRPNRGFEDVAISKDGKTLYTALQSPMEYRPPTPSPDPRSSLAIRVFRIDIRKPSKPVVTGQWIYPLDASPTASRPLVDKVSALVWVGPDRLLVEERDDPTSDLDQPQNTQDTRLYLADLASATQIPADSKWNGPAAAETGGQTLEQWYIPGVGPDPSDLPVAADKCLYADVAAMLRGAGVVYPPNPARAGNGKIEGVALVRRKAGGDLLAVVNDNDFGIFVPNDEQLNLLAAPSSCTPA